MRIRELDWVIFAIFLVLFAWLGALTSEHNLIQKKQAIIEARYMEITEQFDTLSDLLLQHIKEGQ